MFEKTRRKSTYAAAGVDRTLRNKSKKELAVLNRTYQYSRYGLVVKLPYGNIFPVTPDLYLDLAIEGVGTKVLLAQLADKNDTIGVDGVAMAVNDVIRSGARPLAVVDNIHAHVSDPDLIREWMKGIVKGAEEAECIVPSGEIGDVYDLIKGVVEGKGFDMVFASVGEVHRRNVVQGNNLRPEDSIIGLRSSGVHSNGVSLARRVLFRQWGGLYEPFDVPNGLEREVVYEVLEPTRIYVKPVLKLLASHKVKALVHITGDAYVKFDKLMNVNQPVGFEFNYFSPQPIFSLIQEASEKLRTPISDDEMFKTFNMGWGFAVIVDSAVKDDIIDSLEGSGIEATQIGTVTDSRRVLVKHDGKKIHLLAK